MNAAPNQPADKFTNMSEIVTDKTESTFFTSTLYNYMQYFEDPKRKAALEEIEKLTIK